jgi:hypothetical protein
VVDHQNPYRHIALDIKTNHIAPTIRIPFLDLGCGLQHPDNETYLRLD